MILTSTLFARISLGYQLEHAINHGMSKSEGGACKGVKNGCVHLWIVFRFFSDNQIVGLHEIHSQNRGQVFPINDILHFSPHQSSCFLIQYFILEQVNMYT